MEVIKSDSLLIKFRRLGACEPCDAVTNIEPPMAKEIFTMRLPDPRTMHNYPMHKGASWLFFMRLVSFNVVDNPYYRANMTALHTIFDKHTVEHDVWQVREFASYLAERKIVVHV